VSQSIQTLLSLADTGDSCSKSWSELEPLWIDAINQRFQECRGKIQILDQLADRAGIKTINRLDDVVPLLFAHTAYKSYPEAFIDHNRWDRMNLWLNTLSKHPVVDVDVAGISDADEWIKRLHTAGHYVFATSGTSGKNSFINQSASDVAFANKVTLPKGIAPNSRPIFVLGPRKAPNRASATFTNLVETLGRPDAIYYLADAEMRITDLSMMARMRRKIGEGTAMPSEISEFEQSIQLRRAAGDQLAVQITDHILAHRHEPSIIIGLTPQLYQIVVEARKRGLADGCFHPDTLVITGGGAKGIDLPKDHVDQIMKFMGMSLDNFTQGYGMQEASSGARMFESGRYEFPGWIVPLLLDDTGEQLLDVRQGTATGRMALFDVSIDGRWGGIISGDRVVMDYSNSASGRTGPAVLEIGRYSELEGGDDKLTCAGTIDSFVRGAVGE
jgi:hypothetical protein